MDGVRSQTDIYIHIYIYTCVKPENKHSEVCAGRLKKTA